MPVPQNIMAPASIEVAVLPMLLGRGHAMLPGKEHAVPAVNIKNVTEPVAVDDEVEQDSVGLETIEAFVERYEYSAKSYSTLYKKMFMRAEGIHMFDDAGKAYVDCLNGFGVNPLGHNPPILQETMMEYMQTCPLWSAIDLYTPERVEFIETLFAALPEELQADFKICFTGPTGSEANEMALKMVRKTTGRQGIFAFRGCFHGSTITTSTLTGNAGDGDLIRSAAHLHHMSVWSWRGRKCGLVPYACERSSRGSQRWDELASCNDHRASAKRWRYYSSFDSFSGRFTRTLQLARNYFYFG
jgi:hypothetical protein